MRRLRYVGAVLAAAVLVGVTGTAAQADIERNGDFDEQISGATFWKGWKGSPGVSATTKRADDASWFETTWDASTYGWLPRIGKTTQYDPDWGVAVDDTAESLPAEFSFTFDEGDPAKDGIVWIGLYGWVDDGTPGWPYATEFYVIQDWRKYPPNVDGGAVYKGTYTFGGAEYDVFNATHAAGQQQWYSVRKTPATSGTVDVKQHFDTWRELGMANGTVAELVWSVEGMDNTDGTVRYDRWSIPDLRPAAATAPASMAGSVRYR
ncbi:MAG: glycoside hydrolase family 11 protein [Phycicoccus sp.]